MYRPVLGELGIHLLGTPKRPASRAALVEQVAGTAIAIAAYGLSSVVKGQPTGDVA